VKGKCEAYSAFTRETDHNLILEIAKWKPAPDQPQRKTKLKPQDPIQAILDALALQQPQRETSRIVNLEPGLILEAMNALRGYRKMFAPVIPGLTDTLPIYAAYNDRPMRPSTPFCCLSSATRCRSSVTLSAGSRFESLLRGALFQRQCPSVLVSLPALRLAFLAFCPFWNRTGPADS
jgi:hypothetical protein